MLSDAVMFMKFELPDLSTCCWDHDHGKKISRMSLLLACSILSSPQTRPSTYVAVGLSDVYDLADVTWLVILSDSLAANEDWEQFDAFVLAETKFFPSSRWT